MEFFLKRFSLFLYLYILHPVYAHSIWVVFFIRWSTHAHRCAPILTSACASLLYTLCEKCLRKGAWSTSLCFCSIFSWIWHFYRALSVAKTQVTRNSDLCLNMSCEEEHTRQRNCCCCCCCSTSAAHVMPSVYTRAILSSFLCQKNTCAKTLVKCMTRYLDVDQSGDRTDWSTTSRCIKLFIGPKDFIE